MKLAPQSELLSSNLLDFSQSGGRVFNGGAALSVMLGFKFSDKERTSYRANPLLRLGFSYSSGSYLSNNTFNEFRFPYDTLTSNQTGEQVYVDSVISRSSGANYRSDQIRFNGSLIFRTNPEARWSLYSGIGITAGVSLNATTDIYYTTNLGTETVNSNDNGYGNGYGYGYENNSSSETISESYRNNTNFGFSAYVPFGIDFRLGKKREFWKRLHLFYEIKPEISVVSIPELYTITSARLQQGVGIRVTFD
jgi:hypothetical protein